MTTKNEPLAKTRNDHVRLQILKQHRLIVFERAFDRYLEGKVDAGYVSYRGKKLVEARG